MMMPIAIYLLFFFDSLLNVQSWKGPKKCPNTEPENRLGPRLIVEKFKSAFQKLCYSLRLFVFYPHAHPSPAGVRALTTTSSSAAP
jgi:hypothetical protein